jgi:tetratricopeptide (TPR) repeat protein
MNSASLVLVSVLASAGVAAGIVFALVERAPPTSAPAPAGVSAEEFRAAIERLEAEQQALRAALQPVRGTAAEASERTAVPAVSDAQVEAALRRVMAAREQPEAAVANSDAPALDVAEQYAALRGKGSVSFWTNQEAWRKVHAAGKLDELIAMFEANATDNPNDPNAHMQLADAYLSYLQFDPSKGSTLGIKSDQVLDRVLELDENHWQARFTKAVSYSFWPDFLGKKKEALAQFDRLVTQHETMRVTPEQAQVYLFYGNLLEQSGQGDKAREIWQKGLARHPDSDDLRQRIAR